MCYIKPGYLERIHFEVAKLAKVLNFPINLILSIQDILMWRHLWEHIERKVADWKAFGEHPYHSWSHK
jgi:hypothetical protein